MDDRRPATGYPENLLEAADATTNESVLNRLWDIVVMRISEEEARHDQVVDRGYKTVTIGVSTLGALIALLTFTKDTLGQSLQSVDCLVHGTLVLTGGGLLVTLICSAKAFLNALEAAGVKENRTWHEKDLARVDLADRDDRAYERYLIKAGRNILSARMTVNEDRYKSLEKAIRSLSLAVYSLFGFSVGLVALTFLISGRRP